MNDNMSVEIGLFSNIWNNEYCCKVNQVNSIFFRMVLEDESQNISFSHTSVY